MMANPIDLEMENKLFCKYQKDNIIYCSIFYFENAEHMSEQLNGRF